MADVFISYSRKDKAFVERLDEALKRRNCEAWVDWEGIPPTAEFMQEIFRAIEGTDTFVFVLSPDSIASTIARQELAHAVAHNKRMIPLVVRPVSAAEVPEPLAKLNWIFFVESGDFAQATATLVTALETDLEWVRAHTRLLTRAVEWEAKGKNNSFVLRGVDLRAAERWLTEAGTDRERQPTALQTEYIIESRRAETRRQRTIRAWVSVAAVIAVVLAVIAFRQNRLAHAKEVEVQKTFSQSDFLRASELLDQNRSSEALAFLARACRTDPANQLAATRLFTLLSQRNWIRPVTGPLSQPNAQGRTPPLEQVRFSADGSKFVVTTWGEDGGEAHVWETATGKLLTSNLPCGSAGFNYQAHPCLPDERSFDRNQRVILLARRDELHLWNLATTNAKPAVLKHKAVVSAAQFCPDDAQILAGCEDGTIMLWDRTRQAPVRAIRPVEGVVRAFSRDGTCAVTTDGDAESSIRLWQIDLATGKVTAIGPKVEGRFLALSEDGKQICYETVGKIHFRRIPSGEEHAALLENVPESDSEYLQRARFRPDGRQVVTISRRASASDLHADQEFEIGQVRVWNSDDGTLLSRLRHQVSAVDPSEGFHPYQAAISPDGSHVGSVAYGDPRTLVSNSKEQGDHHEPLAGTDFTDVAFSPDGRRILVGLASGAAQVGELQPATALVTKLDLQTSTKSAEARFSVDGSFLLLIDETGQQHSFESATGKGIPLSPDHKAISSRWKNPQGTRGFARVEPPAPGEEGDDEYAERRLMDLASGKPVYPELRTFSSRIAFSSAGRRLLIGNEGDIPARSRLDIRSAETGLALRPTAVGFSQGWFSPDGDKVIMSGEKGLVVYDITKGQPVTDPIRGPAPAAATLHKHHLLAVILKEDGRAELHRHPILLDRAPPLLAEIAEAIGQMKLSNLSATEPCFVPLSGLRQKVEGMKEPDAPPYLLEWMKSFLAPRQERPATQSAP